MNNKRKRNFCIIVGLIAILILSGVGVNSLIRKQRYNNEINNIKIININLENIKDGEYIGEYKVEYISAKVKVIMKDHKIIDIEYIYHKNERGEKANIITKNIVKYQKIDVDTISGATNSSKVIQKAVEKALTK